MSHPFQCPVDPGESLFTVRPDGVFDLAASAVLRSVLADSLTQSPEAIVVDLAHLRLTDDVHLTLLGSFASQAAGRQPASTVLLCAPTDDVTTAIKRLGIAVPVYPTWTAAASVAQSAAPHGRRCIDLLPTLDSLAQTRAFVLRACEASRVPADVIAHAQVVATELASNVIRHARTAMQLIVRCTAEQIYIAVCDGSPRPARLTGPSHPAAASGRGLMLVEAFTHHWGCTPTGSGKTTWALMRYRPLHA